MDNTHQFKFGNLVGHRNNPMKTTLYKSSLKLKDSDDVIKLFVIFSERKRVLHFEFHNLDVSLEVRAVRRLQNPLPQDEGLHQKIEKIKAGRKEKVLHV